MEYNKTSDGWIQYNGSQYFINDDLLPMENARLFCKKNHADLVVITGQTERKFLWKQVFFPPLIKKHKHAVVYFFYLIWFFFIQQFWSSNVIRKKPFKSADIRLVSALGYFTFVSFHVSAHFRQAVSLNINDVKNFKQLQGGYIVMAISGGK